MVDHHFLHFAHEHLGGTTGTTPFAKPNTTDFLQVDQKQHLQLMDTSLQLFYLLWTRTADMFLALRGEVGPWICVRYAGRIRLRLVMSALSLELSGSWNQWYKIGRFELPYTTKLQKPREWDDSKGFREFSSTTYHTLPCKNAKK